MQRATFFDRKQEDSPIRKTQEVIEVVPCGELADLEGRSECTILRMGEKPFAEATRVAATPLRKRSSVFVPIVGRAGAFKG